MDVGWALPTLRYSPKSRGSILMVESLPQFDE